MSSENDAAPDARAWKAAILNRRMLTCVFTGFASGLPLYVLIQLVPFWLRAEDVSLKDIGFFALVTLPFSWKFLWSPLLDRYRLPLGRRRGWMLAMQLALVGTIAALGALQPGERLDTIMVLCFAVGLFSATQDVALDAFRREILPDRELGLGNSIHVQAYRIAGLVPGSLSLILADALPWHWVFPITAAFMIPGVVMTLLVREPPSKPPRSMRDAVVEPFTEFLGRNGIAQALLVLCFIFFYKLGDNMATALSAFYQDLGFTGLEIGTVAKFAGLSAAIVGAMFGGLLMVGIGINRALWLFGAVQMVTILGCGARGDGCECGGPRHGGRDGVSRRRAWHGGIRCLHRAVGDADPCSHADRAAHLSGSTASRSGERAHGLHGRGGDPATMEPFPAAIMEALMALGVPADGLRLDSILSRLYGPLALPGMLLLFRVAPWGEDRSPAG